MCSFISFPSLNRLLDSVVGFSQEIYSSKLTAVVHTVDPFSGTLENPRGSTLNISIPENSLSEDIVLDMVIYSIPESSVISTKPLPDGMEASDSFYNISFTDVSDGSAVHTLDTAVTLTFLYTDEEVAGIDESTLGAYHWTGTSWTALDGNVVDTSSNTVTARTHSFSFFSLLGSSESVTPPVPPVTESVNNVGGGSSHSTSTQKPRLGRKADLNGDKKVDLVDFVILSYWYKHAITPSFAKIEKSHLSGDGKVLLEDFSILAYHWTDKNY